MLLQGVQAPAQKPPPPQTQSAFPQLHAPVGLPMDSAADLSVLVDTLLGGKPAPAATTIAEPLERASTEPTALPATPSSPEQFLQWLAAIKPLQPAAVLADAAAPLTLEITQGNITTPPPVLLAADAEHAILESAIASLQGLGSTPPLAAGLAALPQQLQPVSAVTTPIATSTTLALDSPDWPQRLGEQIQWRLGEGVQEARIEISPRELGTVQLHLSMDESGLRVHLTAAHAETRALLHNELPRLREALQQGGVLLADAQVGREAPGQQQGRHAASTARPGRLDDDAEPLVATRSGWSAHRGLLDDYA